MRASFLAGPLSVLALSLLLVGAVLALLSLAGQPPLVGEDVQRSRRRAMVQDQLRARGIRSEAVLAAMEKVPRHRFVPLHLRGLAYSDGPLPIGRGQTISQPYIVALMTELAGPSKEMRVLEIGTGSGYQAAVLAACVGEVDTIEVVPDLGKTAAATLRELGYRNVQTRIGDGYEGWRERAPYDAILLTTAPPDRIPQPLLDQLKVGGRLVAPVGRDDQKLVRITRTEKGFEREVIAPVRFVPMTGKAQDER
ncbi:MAG: protein-L-isoaspartate(D-aspartate) O-methyltransferase [Isosphaeraceae bacterium]